MSAGQKTGMSFYTMQTQRGSYETMHRISIHFVRPVIYRFFVVNLPAQPSDERARSPYLSGLPLLGQHGVEDGREPVLELAVVVIWNDEIPNTIHAPLSQVGAIHAEVC